MDTNNCITCNSPTNNPKYCSRRCAAITNNKLTPKRKTQKKCSKCDEVVRDYRSTLCKNHYDEYTKNKRDNILNLSLQDYINPVSTLT